MIINHFRGEAFFKYFTFSDIFSVKSKKIKSKIRVQYFRAEAFLNYFKVSPANFLSSHAALLYYGIFFNVSRDSSKNNIYQGKDSKLYYLFNNTFIKKSK